MREEFLHYLWKFKKFAFTKLETTTKETVVIKSVGQHNSLAGPDFFNAQLEIGGQAWAGNVEIHLKSSDWYVHRHEEDPAYDSVILHLVWEDDIAVYRKNNTTIPTVCLADFVSKESLKRYEDLFANSYHQWINCELDFGDISTFIYDHWIERLFFERLEKKTDRLQELYKKNAGDWEAVLFQLLSRNFGTKINGDAFEALATSLDFSVIRKCARNAFQLEALLLGRAHLIPEIPADSYTEELATEYAFVTHKFKLTDTIQAPVQFFRLRPDNFPTIRLSQLSNLYALRQGLFQQLISARTVAEYYQIFEVTSSRYWQSHYNFGRKQSPKKRQLSKAFIELLLINTVIPIKFAYAKSIGADIHTEIIDLIQRIKPERNALIKKYDNLRPKAQNALESQALLQLHSEYCKPNKCLQCAIGIHLLETTAST